MRYGENMVIIKGLILTWDGITNPKPPKEAGKKGVYNVTCLIHPNAPELQEVAQIAQTALNESQWRGQIPHKGHMPTGNPVDPDKFGSKYAQYLSISAVKGGSCPPVVDINGQEMDPILYGPMLYPGCIIDLLVSAYAYDNVNKGIGLSIEGIRIADCTAPRIEGLTGAMTAKEVANAFAGGYGGPSVSHQPSAPATPAYPGIGPPTPAAPPGPPAPGVAPAPARLMTPAAQYSYDQYIGAGWNDAQLIAAGFMVGGIRGPM